MPQINMPQSKKKDPLEVIMQGVQLASGILGIRKDLVQTDYLQQQKGEAANESAMKAAETQRKAEGRMLPFEELEASQKFTQVPEGTKGAVRLISPTSGAPAFYQPRQEDNKDSLGWATLKYKMQNDTASQVAEREKLSREDKFKADEINKEFLNHESTKKYVSAFEKASGLEQLLKKKQAVIDSIALRQVFGLSGDTGAIRAEDLQQFSTNPAVLDRFVAIFNKGLSGETIPDNERKYLSDFAQEMGANARIRLTKYADQYAKRISNTTKFDNKKALEFLNPENLLTESVQGMQAPDQQIGVGQAGAAPKKSNSQLMDEFLQTP